MTTNNIRGAIGLAALFGSWVVAPMVHADYYGAVKVECFNNNCDQVTVQQICDTYSAGSQPVAIACDETAWPGMGSPVPCGNGLTCRPWGSIWPTDPLSAYCENTGGNDAIVTCRYASAPVSPLAPADADDDQAPPPESDPAGAQKGAPPPVI